MIGSGLGLTGAVGSKGDRAIQIHSYLFGLDQIWTVDGRSNGRGRVDQYGAAPVAGGEEDGGAAHGLGRRRRCGAPPASWRRRRRASGRDGDGGGVGVELSGEADGALATPASFGR